MTVPPQLAEVSERVGQGQTPSITVREFISWFWGSKRRGSFVVSAIRDALAEVKLNTSPDFDETYIDASIGFVPAGPPAAAGGNGAGVLAPSYGVAVDVVDLASAPGRVVTASAMVVSGLTATGGVRADLSRATR